MRQDRSILGLDLIRLFAALLVAFYHWTYWRWLAGGLTREELTTTLDPLSLAVSSGWVGVQIFFVISGFVITFSAQNKSCREFVTKRALRLYPAVWVCATITLLVLPMHEVGWAYARSMLLFPFGPWVSAVFWTLAVELVFYALVAGVLARRGSGALPRLALILGAWSTAFWGLKILNRVAGLGLDSMFESVEGYRGYLLLLHHGCHFATGMLIYQWYKTGRVPWIAFVFGGVGVMEVTAASFSNAAAAPLLAPAIWVVAIALMLAVVHWNGWLHGHLQRWSQTVRTLGLLTYPIYLVHNEIGGAIAQALEPAGLAFALTVAMAVVLAISWFTVQAEPYIRSWMSGALRTRNWSLRPAPGV